jgi:hypothetical protein
MEFTSLFEEQTTKINDKINDKIKINDDKTVIKNRRTRETELEDELAQTKSKLDKLETKYNSLELKLNDVLDKLRDKKRENELGTELLSTKKQLYTLDNKYTNLNNKYTNLELAIDTLVEKQTKKQPFTVIPYFGKGIGENYKFYSTGCEEMLISNNILDHGPNGRKILPAVLYIDNILFGEIDKFMNSNASYEIQQRTQRDGAKHGYQPNQIKGQNSVEFLKQFTNIKRLIIHIGYDIRNSCEYGGLNRQLDNLIYTIVTIMSFSKDYEITIRGKYAPEFQKTLLKELLKHTNYKKLKFEVDNTQMNGTYSDDWNKFMINGIQGINPIREIQNHCINNSIGFEHNIS